MGQYHGKDPWYLEYHGAETVHAFSSSYPRMYAIFLHRTRVYLSKQPLQHSSISELLVLFPNSLSYVDTFC